MEKDGFYYVPLNDDSARLLCKLQKFQYLDGESHTIYEDFKMQYRLLDEVLKSISDAWLIK